MSSTQIPGLKAQHAIVRDACRRLRGDAGAIDEALARLRNEARVLLDRWPGGEGHQLHFVLTVERGGTATL